MLSVWLPTRTRLARVGAFEPLARVLVKADRQADATPGLRALIEHDFKLLPGAISEAALSRLADVGDAGFDNWLRADPVHLGADAVCLRLLAHADLGLDRAGAEDLSAALKPLFGDLGYELSVAAPERWYLRLHSGTEVPAFPAPEQVLGDRLDAHLPTGPLGLRWQRLLTESQMSLHQHRLNLRRLEAGQLPINSVWFWGGGRLPNRIDSRIERVTTIDPVLGGLARHGQRTLVADFLHAIAGAEEADTLLDLRAAFAEPAMRQSVLDALLLALKRVDLARVAFESGERFVLKRWHRFRFWRRT